MDPPATYRCRNCQTPIAYRDELLSKSYMVVVDPFGIQAKTGQAFLFSDARNIVFGQKQETNLITGVYTIASIFCSNCGEELGWKYLQASEARQKFKEGKFILELSKISKHF
ncbi:protein yippee-like At4g27745 isoform X1 [Vigna radiata var. radiata]|uniref:Protein yippee-like n=1 Tax=Vigna radiata var. radiata TaxID=3916 RepID=A0A3Q0FDY1_VIGRR|nr:protein yippee-like At4g27745 isoform X1 [Vigna radiata var. radiata]